MRSAVLTLLLALTANAHADPFDDAEWQAGAVAATSTNGWVDFEIPKHDGVIDRIGIQVTGGLADFDHIVLTYVDGDVVVVARPDDDPMVAVFEIPTPRWDLERISLDVYDHTGNVGLESLFHELDVSRTMSREEAKAVIVAFAHPTPRPIPNPWTLLGEDEVDLVDDVVTVAREASTWGKVKLVVVGDPVRVTSVELGLRRRKKSAKIQRAPLVADLADGDSRVIEIRGRRRSISRVRIHYERDRLDASTKVQVWAR